MYLVPILLKLLKGKYCEEKLNNKSRKRIDVLTAVTLFKEDYISIQFFHHFLHEIILSAYTQRLTWKVLSKRIE